MASLELPCSVETLKIAATACGLQLLEGETETPSFPPQFFPRWLLKEFSPRTGHSVSQHILRVHPDSTFTFRLPPHQVLVYERDDLLHLVWLDHEDGMGLMAFFGQDGERLRLAFAIELAHQALEGKWTHVSTMVESDGYITITYEELMSQKQITARIDPKGGVTIKTSGFDGAECLAATRDIEKRLGNLVSDAPTDEMNQKVEQHVAAGG